MVLLVLYCCNITPGFYNADYEKSLFYAILINGYADKVRVFFDSLYPKCNENTTIYKMPFSSLQNGYNKTSTAYRRRVFPCLFLAGTLTGLHIAAVIRCMPSIAALSVYISG